jgi:hypothetical protein
MEIAVSFRQSLFAFVIAMVALCGNAFAETKPMGLKSEDHLASDFLMSAVAVNQDLYTTMESFVCHERIERYQSVGFTKDGHIDTVTATVSFENGAEQYSDIHQNNRMLPSLADSDGAWSEGEFGTLLKQTLKLLASKHVTFEGEEPIESGYGAIYSFDVTAEESPWDLTVSHSHYGIPFYTRVWIRESSGEIVKIERTASDATYATGIATISWSVSLVPVTLGDKQWLLPDTAEYRVGYRHFGRSAWNTMKFSEYRRYGSKSSVRFG